MNRERGIFRGIKEQPGFPTIEQFMQIREIEQAKSLVVEVFRSRLESALPRSLSATELIDKRSQAVSRVFDYAAEKHKGKKRLTGEEYIFHPAAVTYMVLQDRHISAEDLEMVAKASLCHDVLEDTPTTPRELREEIGSEATRYVIMLSKNMKIFDKFPELLQEELGLIGPEPTPDEVEFLDWLSIKNEPPRSRLKLLMNKIKQGPKPVRRIKVRDRDHNLRTLPIRHDPNRSAEDQAKVDKLWREILPETKNDIRPIAVSLGLAGIAIARELRKSYIEQSRRKQ